MQSSMPACGSTGAGALAPSRCTSWSQRTSPPAQKARSPAPVRTITPTSRAGEAGRAPRPGEKEAAALRAGASVVYGLAHLGEGLAGEGVHHLGPVDGDP